MEGGEPGVNRETDLRPLYEGSAGGLLQGLLFLRLHPVEAHECNLQQGALQRLRAFVHSFKFLGKGFYENFEDALNRTGL